MSEFKKWFEARARNPDKITLEEAFAAGAQAQPAPSVPREAIDKMLTQLMDIAVSNGANSISMPDEYVEVAAWLCGIPAQPAPSAPEREFLERVIGLCSHRGPSPSSIEAFDP